MKFYKILIPFIALISITAQSAQNYFNPLMDENYFYERVDEYVKEYSSWEKLNEKLVDAAKKDQLSKNSQMDLIMMMMGESEFSPEVQNQELQVGLKRDDLDLNLNDIALKVATLTNGLPHHEQYAKYTLASIRLKARYLLKTKLLRSQIDFTDAEVYNDRIGYLLAQYQLFPEKRNALRQLLYTVSSAVAPEKMSKRLETWDVKFATGAMTVMSIVMAAQYVHHNRSKIAKFAVENINWRTAKSGMSAASAWFKSLFARETGSTMRGSVAKLLDQAASTTDEVSAVVTSKLSGESLRAAGESIILKGKNVATSAMETLKNGNANPLKNPKIRTAFSNFLIQAGTGIAFGGSYGLLSYFDEKYTKEKFDPKSLLAFCDQASILVLDFNVSVLEKEFSEKFEIYLKELQTEEGKKKLELQIKNMLDDLSRLSAGLEKYKKEYQYYLEHGKVYLSLKGVSKLYLEEVPEFLKEEDRLANDLLKASPEYSFVFQKTKQDLRLMADSYDIDLQDLKFNFLSVKTNYEKLSRLQAQLERELKKIKWLVTEESNEFIGPRLPSKADNFSLILKK